MLRSIGSFVTAVVIAAAPVAAQDVKPVQVTIGGGFTGVYGAAADHIGNGGNFTLGVLFHLNPLVALQGEYGWNGMKKKELLLPVSVNPLDATTNESFFADGNMQYGDFNVLLSPPVNYRASPYFITGLGVYHRPVNITSPAVGFTTVCDPYWYACYPAAVSVDQVIGERSSTDFGMNFGGGVNFKTSDHTSVYFEIRYHYVWGPEISPDKVPTPLATGEPLKANGKFLPITVGFRF